MTTISLHRGRLVAHQDGTSDWRSPAFREFVRITGVKFRHGTVSMPALPRLFELFCSIDPESKATMGVTEWYNNTYLQERTRSVLGEQTDLTVDYPLAGKLWPFQRVGIQFLLLNRRTLLCDEPGLGKTATTVVAMMRSGATSKVLIVCPNSLKGWWKQEIEQWAVPVPSITVVDARKRREQFTLWEHVRGGVLILNWELLRLMPELRKVKWEWLICDEAHRTKNRKTKIFGALNQIRADRVALLTGTPFSNNPSELWTLLHIIDPRNYRSFWRFYEMYVDYVEGYFGREIIGVKNPELLRRDLAPRMLRREKKDVLPQLPPKLYKTIPLELHPRQYKMYRDLATKMYTELEDEETLRAVSTLSLITRLRQVVSTTRTVDRSDYSSKLDAVVDLIEDTDDKVVVFSQFRDTVLCLCDRLADRKISYSWIMGGMTSDAVQERVKLFQEGRAKVFAATMQTGGVGLTLTASHTLVFIDKHWNPALQAQSEDRIHRIGQDDSVQIITLHCPGTVDDMVERILTRKLQMADEVLQPALVEHLEEVMDGS